MKQTDFFKCFSDPIRLKIIKVIIDRKSVCVCEFAELLNITQPKISRHLAILRNIKILLDKREGQWIYYSLNSDIPDWAKHILEVIKNNPA